ncbi:MAG: uracil-DNA glycosylase [Bacteroidota bacterium]
MPEDTELNEEFSQLVDDIQRYFMQQKDLFGNVISVEAKARAKSARPADPVSLLKTVNEPWVHAGSLDAFDREICTCLKCPLGHTRTKFVFGVGDPHADILCIGEAPGADEDAQGEPFVGRAGQLLNKILDAIGFKREDVYICNLLKCRPPGNRDPEVSEVETCTPYLWKQIELIKPKIILALGRMPGQFLLKTNDGLSKLRGKVHDFHGMKLIVTYHPAALLRNPGWKRPTWEDVQMLRRLYDEMKKAGS